MVLASTTRPTESKQSRISHLQRTSRISKHGSAWWGGWDSMSRISNRPCSGMAPTWKRGIGAYIFHYEGDWVGAAAALGRARNVLTCRTTLSRQQVSWWRSHSSRRQVLLTQRKPLFTKVSTVAEAKFQCCSRWNRDLMQRSRQGQGRAEGSDYWQMAVRCKAQAKAWGANPARLGGRIGWDDSQGSIWNPNWVPTEFWEASARFGRTANVLKARLAHCGIRRMLSRFTQITTQLLTRCGISEMFTGRSQGELTDFWYLRLNTTTAPIPRKPSSLLTQCPECHHDLSRSCPPNQPSLNGLMICGEDFGRISFTLKKETLKKEKYNHRRCNRSLSCPGCCQRQNKSSAASKSATPTAPAKTLWKADRLVQRRVGSNFSREDKADKPPRVGSSLTFPLNREAAKLDNTPTKRVQFEDSALEKSLSPEISDDDSVDVVILSNHRNGRGTVAMRTFTMSTMAASSLRPADDFSSPETQQRLIEAETVANSYGAQQSTALPAMAEADRRQQAFGLARRSFSTSLPAFRTSVTASHCSAPSSFTRPWVPSVWKTFTNKIKKIPKKKMSSDLQLSSHIVW